VTAAQGVDPAAISLPPTVAIDMTPLVADLLDRR